MEVDLQKIITFGGKLWNCVGAISSNGESFFKVKSTWIMLPEDGKEQQLSKEFLLKNCVIAFYDQENIKPICQNDKFSYIGKHRKELVVINIEKNIKRNIKRNIVKRI